MCEPASALISPARRIRLVAAAIGESALDSSMFDVVDYAIYVGAGLPLSPHCPVHLVPNGNIYDIAQLLTGTSR